MSKCVFIAADCPLPEVRPAQDYPCHFNLDTGVIYDSGADDDYCLLPFNQVDIYCKKNMVWSFYSIGTPRDEQSR